MIATDRLILRPFAEHDRTAFALLNADPEVMRHFPETLTRAGSDALFDRIVSRWQEDGISFGVAERRTDGAFLGMVGLAHLRFEMLPAPTVEVGWRLGRGNWGRGYATEAARGWLAHGFGEMALDEVVAIAVPENVPSLAVMARLAMRRDPSRDFDHPAFPPGHRLSRHVLHVIRRVDWQGSAQPAAQTGNSKTEAISDT